MAVDRGGRNNKRQMRAFQKLASEAIGSLALIEGSGITFTGDEISVDLKDTDPGLFFALTGLSVNLGVDPGLTLSGGLSLVIAAGEPFTLPSGLTLVLNSVGGLEVIAEELGVKLAPDSGMNISADGLAVDPGTTPIFTAVAAETISALQVIFRDGSGARVASAAIFTETAAAIGVAVTAAAIGNQVTYKSIGEISDGSWSWTPGASLYLNDAGVLSETPGTHLRGMGIAMSATKISLNLLVPVRRS